MGGLLSSNTRDAHQSGFPYLHPNLLLAALYLVASILVLFLMEETLDSLQGTDSYLVQRIIQRLKRHSSKKNSQPAEEDHEPNEAASPSETTPLINQTPKPKRKKKLPFRRIWTFNVLCTLTSNSIIVGHLGTFSALWSIFLTASTGPSPPSQHSFPLHFTGGLGMAPRDVGFALSLLGAIGMILQLGVYPMLQDRLGTVRIWRTALFVFPFVYLLAPYPSFIASARYFKGQIVWIWLSMTAILLLFTLGRTGVVPATTLLINDCTPHPSVRGTIHAAAAVLGHLSRSIVPVAVLAVFGQGLEIGVVGLGFWCLAVLAILSCIASRWVIEGSNGQEIVLEDESGEEEARIEDGGSGQGNRT